MPVDPAMAVGGAEWQIPSIAPTEGVDGSVTATGAPEGVSFGNALGNAMGSLQTQQNSAAEAVQQLATGQLEDPSQAVLAMERARLSMEFASQVRNKGVEAYQEIFRTQV